MDKVKLVLAVVKKHYFWASTAVVILLALISWAKATSDLAGRFAERKSKIETQFSEMQKIVEKSNHPNAAVLQALADKKEQLEKKVLAAWEILYKQQQDNNRLPEVLSDDFKQAFQRLKADSAMKPDQELKPEERLPQNLREIYQNFIPEHFPTLFDVVQVRRPAEDKPGTKPGKSTLLRTRMEAEDPGRRLGRASGREGRETGETQAMVGVVDWDEADRKRIEERFHWEKTPSTAKVLLAQEDLWVYEALLRVIKNTNGDAKTNYDAAVKRIDLLQVGAEVASFGRGAAAAGFSGAERLAAASGTSPSGTDNTLLERRYVDVNFNPLAANAPPPYAEFKMMPVRMQLLVQQKKIPKLLVECANSTMPIEVRTVRLWPGTGPALDTTAATAGAPGLEAGGRDMMGRATSRTPGFGHVERESAGTAGQQENNGKDVPVEIEGIVYIYNPPDKTKLGTGTGAAGQIAPEGEEATPESEEAPMEAPTENAEPSTEPSAEPSPDRRAEPKAETRAETPAPPARAAAGSVQLVCSLSL